MLFSQNEQLPHFLTLNRSTIRRRSFRKLNYMLPPASKDWTCDFCLYQGSLNLFICRYRGTCALRLFCIKKLDSMSEEKNKRAAWKKFQNQMKEKRTGKGNTVYKNSFHEVLAVDHSCLMNSVKYFISVLLYQDSAL